MEKRSAGKDLLRAAFKGSLGAAEPAAVLRVLPLVERFDIEPFPEFSAK